MYPIGVTQNVADVTLGDYSGVIAKITAVFNTTNLGSVLAEVAEVAVVLCLMWWSVKKVSSSIMRAFKRGKLRL